jgi:hypothetical protein
MALVSSQVAVGTSATLLAKADADGCRVVIHKQQNHIIYVGGPNVTTSNGFLFDHDGTVDLDLEPNEEIYGVSTSGETAYIMTTRNR